MKDLIWRPFDTSLLTSGFNLDDPTQFAGRIHRVFKLGLSIDDEGEGLGGDDGLPPLEDDVTTVLKVEFDCRPGAIAQSWALREPKYRGKAAYCHFGREPYTKEGFKFFEG